MPIYEYQCRKCGHRMEAMQRLSDAPLTECPECRGELTKLISAPAFQFKGSGWYATDYGGKKGSEKGEADGKGAGESKSEGKSESSESKGAKADDKPPVAKSSESSKKAASSG